MLLHQINARALFSAFGLSALIIFVQACTPDHDHDITISHNDQKLIQLVETASKGKGLSFFMLPASDDFSAIPQDPRNPITPAKVALGKLLFHETALAVNPKSNKGLLTYSCASCHHAKAGFQACLPQGIGEGGIGFGHTGEGRIKNNEYIDQEIDVQPIRTPSALNSAFQTNILWNGQFGATGVNVGTEAAWTVGTPKEKNNLGYEGIETQAIAGLTVHRLKINNTFMMETPIYKQLFNEAFADLPISERISDITAGLAIAAYERTLLANQAPFQRWLRGDYSALTPAQRRGATYFFGEANCVACHTGAALNDMQFYALGMSDLNNAGNIYNINDNQPEHKGRGGFTGRAEDMYKFKVPQLYNLKDSPFYGHGASFSRIIDVIRYKNNAVAENGKVPKSQLSPKFYPLHLSEEAIQDISDFIENALYDPYLSRYVPEALPSDFCFPNNDATARKDLGCE